MYELKKRKNGINYHATIIRDEVVCGEYCDNPHWVNSEARCSIKEFLDKSTHAANVCHSVILSYFGKDKYFKFLKVLG